MLVRGLVLMKTSRDHSMMPRGIQNGTVASFSIFQKLRITCHRRSTRASILRNLTVRLALRKLLGHFESLTPRLELRERANIAKEIGHFLFRFAGKHRLHQGLEPGFLVPAIVGETAFGHWEGKGGQEGKGRKEGKEGVPARRSLL